MTITLNQTEAKDLAAALEYLDSVTMFDVDQSNPDEVRQQELIKRLIVMLEKGAQV